MLSFDVAHDSIENVLSLAVIKPPRELSEVAIKMFDRDMMKHPNNPTLQERPKALDSVSVDWTVNEGDAVVDHPMRHIALQHPVTAPFVRVDHINGILVDILPNELEDAGAYHRR